LVTFGKNARVSCFSLTVPFATLCASPKMKFSQRVHLVTPHDLVRSCKTPEALNALLLRIERSQQRCICYAARMPQERATMQVLLVTSTERNARGLSSTSRGVYISIWWLRLRQRISAVYQRLRKTVEFFTLSTDFTLRLLPHTKADNI